MLSVPKIRAWQGRAIADEGGFEAIFGVHEHGQNGREVFGVVGHLPQINNKRAPSIVTRNVLLFVRPPSLPKHWQSMKGGRGALHVLQDRAAYPIRRDGPEVHPSEKAQRQLRDQGAIWLMIGRSQTPSCWCRFQLLLHCTWSHEERKNSELLAP